MHLMPYINAARRRGARLVVIDPRRVPVARKADLHLAIKPGTDVVLAWALAAELERRGGLDHAGIAQHVLGAETFLTAARRLTLAEQRRCVGSRQPRFSNLLPGIKTYPQRSFVLAMGLNAIRMAVVGGAPSLPCRRWPGSSGSWGEVCCKGPVPRFRKLLGACKVRSGVPQAPGL